MPSYIKDTPDFITKTQQLFVEENDWIFSLDVTGLYTNIPHNEGIAACMEKFKIHSETIGCPDKKYLKILLECVLKMNNFIFNQVNYLQNTRYCHGYQSSSYLCKLIYVKI